MLELELSENGQVQAFLNNRVVNYTTALETNLDRRFQEAAPVLEAFLSSIQHAYQIQEMQPSKIMV